IFSSSAVYDSGPQPYGYGYEQPQPYGYGPNNAYQHQVEHQPQSQPQPGPPQQPDPAYAYQQGQVYGGPVGGAPYPQSAQIPYPQTSQTHYPQQQPQQQQQPQPQPQPQLHSQPQQPQIQQSAEYSPGVHAQQSQPQLQPQTQQQPPQSAGPPYVFDPNATYPDPNAQAWAQYYAQGGTDPAGAVYFISVPGVSDTPSPPEQTPQSHQPSLDSYQAQPQQLPAHQELTRQSSTSQRATYTDPNPQPSQYPSQPYYQDPASAPQVSPTSATGGMSSLQRASSATAGVPVPYSYHSPSHQQQLSPIGQSGYAGPGSEGHGYAQPASDGYEAPTPGGYAQSPPSGPGYGSSPSGEYPQGPGARGNVHTLQNQFLDMSIGGDPKLLSQICDMRIILEFCGEGMKRVLETVGPSTTVAHIVLCPPEIAVLRDWQMTNQFLEEFSEGLPSSWTRLRNIIVEGSDLLHLVKSVRTLPNPSRAAASLSPQVSHPWIQVDELRRQGAGTRSLRYMRPWNLPAVALKNGPASEDPCEKIIPYSSEQGSTLFYQKPNTNTVEWKRKKIVLPSNYLLYNLHRAHSSLVNQSEILVRVYHMITA
ncbi:hypothetical protein EV424DRAFT_1355549, partial [Suillus variegatus]